MKTSDLEKTDAKSGGRPSVDALIPEIRKAEYQDVRGISVMRALHPVQDLCTRLLIRTSVTSRQLIVVWVALSLTSYAISSIGTPITFVGGSLILYLAIVLDLCDGELGRFRATSMSPEEDVRTFIHGMYLDRISHMALTPIWPFAIAWGLYVMCGEPVVFLAGLALASYHTACRALPHLRSYLREFFHERIANLNDQFAGARRLSSEHGNDRWLSRLLAKVELWVRNGKRFNCMILTGGLADSVWLYVAKNDRPVVLLWLFLVWGGLAAVLLLYAIGAPIWRGRLEAEIIEECRKQAK